MALDLSTLTIPAGTVASGGLILWRLIAFAFKQYDARKTEEQNFTNNAINRLNQLTADLSTQVKLHGEKLQESALEIAKLKGTLQAFQPIFKRLLARSEVTHDEREGFLHWQKKQGEKK